MKKIILSGIIATSLFSADNLVTIIENNSLLKLAKNNVSSYVNKSESINIGDGLKNKVFQNYSPYYFTEFQGTEDITPAVITMIGEKSIQYGSIYSKGFGEKYNINTLGVFVKNKKYSIALKTLDYFNKNDLIYTRTKLSDYTKADFVGFESYIKEYVEKDKQERYFNRLSFIYEILDYTNAIYTYEVNNVNIYPINPVLLNIKSIVDNNNYLNEDKTVKEYQFHGSQLTRYCMNPSLDDESYTYTYSPSPLITIDVKQPISLTDLYVFKNKPCPYVYKKNGWNYPKINNGTTLPSGVEQKTNMLMQIKTSRNGGNHLSIMKNLYNNLNTNTTIKKTLQKLNDRGINYGKVLHVNYGLAEGVSNDKVNLAILKTVTTGSIYNDKINLILNEGFMYNTNNLPTSLEDETDTMSELTKDDTNGNNFNTLYYFVNQKIQKHTPEEDNFHKYSEIIPKASQVGFVGDLYGSELLWLTNKSGEYLSPFYYQNKNEILLETEDSIDEEKMIDSMLKYSRSNIDYKENAEQYYPLNLKGISNSYVPLNDEKETAVQYFGPRYKYDLYLDKYTKIIKEEIKLDCTKDVCSDEEKKQSNPIRIVEKQEITNHCGIKMKEPDTKTFNYLVFQDIVNKVIEKPYGELKYHYFKEPFETKYEEFISKTIVPNIFQYLGQVENDKECIAKANIKLEEDLRDELKQNNVENFNFLENIPDEDTVANEKFANNSTTVTAMIDEVLANKTPLVMSYGNEIINNEYSDLVDYEDFKNGPTFFNLFNELKGYPNTEYGEVNTIPTIIVNP